MPNCDNNGNNSGNKGKGPGVPDPNTEEVLKPEQNMPPRTAQKEENIFSSPPERDTKRYRPLGSFAHSKNKDADEVLLPGEQAAKNEDALLQPTRKSGKDEAEPEMPGRETAKRDKRINEPIIIDGKKYIDIPTPESVNKTDKAINLSIRPEIKVGDVVIPTSTRQTKASYLDLNITAARKEGSSVVVKSDRQVKNSSLDISSIAKQKTDTRIPDTNVHVRKDITTQTVEGAEGTVKVDRVVVTEGVVSSKSENSIDANVAFKSPKELFDLGVTDGISKKSEDDITPDEDHGVKTEAPIPHTEQTEKTESEIPDTTSSIKGEQEILDAPDGDVKTEEDINEAPEGLEKTEDEIPDTVLGSKSEQEVDTIEQQNSKSLKEIMDENPDHQPKPYNNEIETPASITVGEESIPVSDSEQSQKTAQLYDIITPTSEQIIENNYDVSSAERNKDIADAFAAQNADGEEDAGKNIGYTNDSSEWTGDDGGKVNIRTDKSGEDDATSYIGVSAEEARSRESDETETPNIKTSIAYDNTTSSIDGNRILESNTGSLDSETIRKTSTDTTVIKVDAEDDEKETDNINERFDYGDDSKDTIQGGRNEDIREGLKTETTESTSRIGIKQRPDEQVSPDDVAAAQLNTSYDESVSNRDNKYDGDKDGNIIHTNYAGESSGFIKEPESHTITDVDADASQLEKNNEATQLEGNVNYNTATPKTYTKLTDDNTSVTPVTNVKVDGSNTTDIVYQSEENDFTDSVNVVSSSIAATQANRNTTYDLTPTTIAGRVETFASDSNVHTGRNATYSAMFEADWEPNIVIATDSIKKIIPAVYDDDGVETTAATYSLRKELDKDGVTYYYQEESNFNYTTIQTTSLGKPSAVSEVLSQAEYREPNEVKTAFITSPTNTLVPNNILDIDSTTVREALVETFNEETVAGWESQGTYIKQAQTAIQDNPSILTGAESRVQETTNFGYTASLNSLKSEGSIAIKNSAYKSDYADGTERFIDIITPFGVDTTDFFGQNEYSLPQYESSVETDGDTTGLSATRDIKLGEAPINANQALGALYATLGVTSAVSAVSNFGNNIADLINTNYEELFTDFSLNDEYKNVLRRAAISDLPSILHSLKYNLNLQGSDGSGFSDFAETVLGGIDKVADATTTAGSLMNHPGAFIMNALRGQAQSSWDSSNSETEKQINIFTQGHDGGQEILGQGGLDYKINDSYAVTSSRFYDGNNVIENNKYSITKDIITDNSSVNWFNIAKDLGVTSAVAYSGLASGYEGIVEKTQNKLLDRLIGDVDQLRKDAINQKPFHLNDWTSTSTATNPSSDSGFASDIPRTQQEEMSSTTSVTWFTNSSVRNDIKKLEQDGDYAQAITVNGIDYTIETGAVWAQDHIDSYFSTSGTGVNFKNINFDMSDVFDTNTRNRDEKIVRLFNTESSESTFYLDLQKSAAIDDGGKVTYFDKDGTPVLNNNDYYDPHLLNIKTAAGTRLSIGSLEGKDLFYEYYKEVQPTQMFSWNQNWIGDDNNLLHNQINEDTEMEGFSAVRNSTAYNGLIANNTNITIEENYDNITDPHFAEFKVNYTSPNTEAGVRGTQGKDLFVQNAYQFSGIGTYNWFGNADATEGNSDKYGRNLMFDLHDEVILSGDEYFSSQEPKNGLSVVDFTYRAKLKGPGNMLTVTDGTATRSAFDDFRFWNEEGSNHIEKVGTLDDNGTPNGTINIDFSNSNIDNKPIIANVPVVQTAWWRNPEDEAVAPVSEEGAKHIMDNSLGIKGYGTLTGQSNLALKKSDYIDIVSDPGKFILTELGITRSTGEEDWSEDRNNTKRSIIPSLFVDKEVITYKEEENGAKDDHSGVVASTRFDDATVSFNSDDDYRNEVGNVNNSQLVYRGGVDSTEILNPDKKSSFHTKISNKFSIFINQSGAKDKQTGAIAQENEKGCGYLAILKNPTNAINENNYSYGIPMQFNPEVSGESRTANWSQQNALGRTNEHFVWSNTSSRTIQFKTTYAIIAPGANDPAWFKDGGEHNKIYDGPNGWGTTWTEAFIVDDILQRYRGLLLPRAYSGSGAIDWSVFDGNRLSPPIISIIFGEITNTEFKGSSSFRQANWIATDLNIDPRIEAGYTNIRNPRIYDVTMTLREIAPNWRSYQTHTEIGVVSK